MLRRSASLAALLVALATACPSRGSTLAIGVVGPASGPLAFVGVQQQRGAQLAAEEINDAGGVRGRRITLAIRDDADRSRLTGIVRELVAAAGAVAIVGPEFAAPLLGSASATARARIPVLLPYAPLDDAGSTPGVFRLRPSASSQISAVARWLVTTRKITSIAAAVPDGEEGRRVDALLRAAAPGRIVATRSFTAGTIDHAPMVRALRASGAGALVVWGRSEDAARIVLAARRLGWHPQIAGSDELFLTGYRSLAGVASDDTAFPLPFRRDWFAPTAAMFLSRYLQRFGIEPVPKQRTLVPELPVLAMAAYDAVKLVAASAGRVGWDRAAIARDVARRTAETGAGGTYDLAKGPAEPWIARFSNFAALYDADPRADRAEQIRFYRVQVSGLAIPRETTGKAAELQQRILEDILTNPEKVEFFKPYRPPRPPPGPL